jgi:murein DD-endopeptidase MepM/ murein hydrolase activator NlpD
MKIQKIIASTILIATFSFVILLDQNIITYSQSGRYKDEISQLDSQKNSIASQLQGINRELEYTQVKITSLSEEVATFQAESSKYQAISLQARELAGEYQKQKEQLEIEIQRLEGDIGKLYKELQILSLSNPIQIVFSSKNIGEFVTKMYSNSNLQKEALRVESELEVATIEKQKSIESEIQSAKNAESAQFLANSNRDQAAKLLDQTKGDENKYMEIKQAQQSEINKINEQRSAFVKRARAEEEQERKRQEEAKKQSLAQAEAARIAAQESNKKFNNPTTAYKPTSNYTPGYVNQTNTGFGDYSEAASCSYSAYSDLGISKGYFATPTTGNFEREFSYCNHDGIDISNGTGTPIVAAADGTVVFSGYSFDGYANMVQLKHTLPNGKTIYTLYAHMATESALNVGQSVSRGQYIGPMGSTGNSTGPHLHFMIIEGSTYAGPGCVWGLSKCYKPRDYINF